MCFCPNVIADGKYQGGIKWYAETKKLSETELRHRIKENKITLVPCGQCLQCRNRSAENWAARCELENRYYENSHFVTLTYDDDHLPVHNMVEDSIYHGLVNPVEYYKGRTIEKGTLFKKDLQDFLKRLREHAQRKNLAELHAHAANEDPIPTIRFFGCGEYGDLSHRPHYHLIIFGLKIPDLKVKYRANGYEHDESAWLTKLWGMGIVDIGSVTYNSCRYVAQYVVKKQKGPEAKALYKKAGITPEFLQMSLKPGIGQMYWEENHIEIYEHDKVHLSEGRTTIPPRFYDNKEDKYRQELEKIKKIEEIGKIIDIEEQEIQLPKMESDFMKAIRKERRRKANDALFAKLRNTDVGILDYYDIQKQKYDNQRKLSTVRSQIDKGR